MRNSALGGALRELRGGLIGIAALSATINVLTLAGSLYLMLLYDRVLPAHSTSTLLGLFLIVVLAYVFHGVFEVLRAQMLADVAAALDRRLIGQVQRIESRIALMRPGRLGRQSPVHDLDQLRSFLAGPGVPALIDLPWILFYLIVLSLLHYWLGLATLLGAAVLAALAVVAERTSKRHVAAAAEASAERRALGDRRNRHAELIAALGMRTRLAEQWEIAHHRLLDVHDRLANSSAVLSGVSRIFRLFLQSAVLTVGALLVIDGKATAGVIFASSILSGRAMAPVDTALAHWRGFVAARQSWVRLDLALARPNPEDRERTLLPAPAHQLVVEQLSLAPPEGGRLAVSEASFAVRAGDAVGIIGPSASGKSSLVRGIVGAWKPVHGAIRLDGATTDQWDSEALGRHIGYLPQNVELFAGSVAENIARFEPSAASRAVLAAAMVAGVHELVLQLPDGYETQVGEEGCNLSAGQRQRIALARALYRDPFLVALDEPNSNLDPEGEAALAAAIAAVKRRGGIVLIVAHRPQILALTDRVLLMRGGIVQAWGARDDVLADGEPRRLMPAEDATAEAQS